MRRTKWTQRIALKAAQYEWGIWSSIAYDASRPGSLFTPAEVEFYRKLSYAAEYRYYMAYHAVVASSH